MKPKPCLAALAGLLIASGLSAQTVTTTTTHSGGTITEINPQAISIRTETSSAPVRYTATSKTTYVDEAGAPVSMEIIKSGAPVTVYYVKEGDRMVADKVVVKKKTTTTTTDDASAVPGGTSSTTTTTIGTITESSPDTLIVRSESSPNPIRYTYSKKTVYVDESGAPVSRELIKSGVPVTVHYVKQGDTMMANRVVVRKKVTTETPPPRIEKRTTTTTTTEGE